MKDAEKSSNKKKSIKFYIIIGIISTVVTEFLVIFCVLLYIAHDDVYFSEHSKNIAESKHNGYFISEYVVDESTKNQEHISIRGIDEVFLERRHYSSLHEENKIITSDGPKLSLICTYKDNIRDSINTNYFNQAFTSTYKNDKRPFVWDNSHKSAQSSIEFRKGDTIFVIFERKKILIEEPIDSFILIRKKH